MKFEIIGSQGDGNRPRALEKILSFLEKFPDGKLLTTQVLAEKAGYKTANSLSNILSHPLLMQFKYKRPGKGTYWGNKKTIKEYAKYAGI
jgi:hypothetical protein